MNQPNPEFGVIARIPTEVLEKAMQTSGALAIVNDYVVDSPEAAQTVNRDLQRIKAEIAWLDGQRQEIGKPLYESWTKLNKFFKALIEPREVAEGHCKKLLLGWEKTQEEERREAERKRQAEELRRRQEEEARAAAERAKAEEIAAQKRREAEEAERRRQAAIAEGNARAAAAAAAEAAKATEQAAAAVESAEAKIANREATAVTTALPPVPEPTKIAGFSSRTIWKGRLKGLNDQERAKSKLDLIKAAATDPQAAALLLVDEKALTRLAGALKSSLTIPGVEAYEDKQAASRTA